MSILSKKTFQFLSDIKKNNNREWFLENKPKYEAVRTELKELSAEWLPGLMSLDKSLRDPDLKGYIFRIYRDARFAKGKLYKTNLGLMILNGGRPAMYTRAGYYLHIEPGKCFIAGGAYMPPPNWLAAIRDEIAENPKKIKKIINSSSFKKYYTLEGPKLKTAPRGYAKDHPEIKLLRHKGFMAIHYIEDNQVLADNFVEYLMSAAKALYPFDEYLNNCLPK